MATQLQLARQGTISDAMRRAAEREGVEAELLGRELADGRLVIPANIRHLSPPEAAAARSPKGMPKSLTSGSTWAAMEEAAST